MNSKHGSIRVFGQRSIAATFRCLPPNPSHDSQGNAGNRASPKSTHLSLSQFLNRKLHKSSLLPAKVEGKSKPFLSPLGLSIPTVGQAATIKQIEEETNSASDRVIFETFKHTDEEKGNLVSPGGVGELENSVTDDLQESKKRKNPLEGGNENQAVRKHVVVLGGESKLKQNGQTQNDHSSKRPRPLYNHYANGRGWWDYDMEGVDNEELGFNEVWEGVASTSLGGMVDWH